MPTSRIVTNDNAGHLEAVRTALHDASEILIISGYATLPGFEHIRSDVKSCLATGGKVTLVLGLDRAGVTSADLVDTLGRLLRRYADRLTVTLVFEQPRQEFLHAKVYWGERRGAMDANVIVGSTNLTASAFDLNYELSLADQGNLRLHKKKLLEFVSNLRNQRQLTAQGAAKLAKEMRAFSQVRTRGESGVVETPTEIGRNRQETLSRILERVIPHEHEPTENCRDWATDFVNEGILIVNDANLDDMTVPTGLSSFYEKGILPKTLHSTAGTAELRQSAPTARISLLPATLSRRITAMQRKAGRRLTKSGFKTPFGVWVPKPLLEDVYEGVQYAFRDLPTTAELECSIESELSNHRKSLQKTVKAIVERVTDGGICPPAEWRAVPMELRHIHERYRVTGRNWSPETDEYKHTLKYIRTALRQRLNESLKSDVCISRVRRLRPGLIRVPANLSENDESLATFLSEVAWQVAEHLQVGKKQTRTAVHQMCQRLDDGFRQHPEALAELSSKLLDSTTLDRNAIGFFTAFGPPPYWVPVLESRQIPGLLYVTESETSSNRFYFTGDAAATASDLGYEHADAGVLFWMEEEGERGFAYGELVDKAGEIKWEDLTPEDEAAWLLEELLSRRELVVEK